MAEAGIWTGLASVFGALVVGVKEQVGGFLNCALAVLNWTWPVMDVLTAPGREVWVGVLLVDSRQSVRAVGLPGNSQ